ncbi:cell division protein FtsQ/DivIB [Pseudonocardia xishanensis]|uniref:cell division protein FtsQ/DivIB n=1 Tax=Pseudonocardia xishanensis TaxID=630995 RepID=UPI0031E9C30A
MADRAPARPAAAERARRIREERAARRDRLRPEKRDGPPRRNDLRFKLRRRIALAVAVLAVLVALGGGFWAVLLYTGVAEVEQVEVTGTLAVPRDSVLAAAAVETGVPLATVDTGAVAQRVAQLPGVGTVQVSRGWPHTVAIEVTERRAVALARTPQGVTLVDATGVAYQPAPEVPPTLPMFGFGAVGPDDPATRAALAVLAALPEDLRARVTTVDVDSPATEPTVRLGLGDRQVRFGSTDRAAQKVAVLVPLLTQDGTVFDVSSPDLPTITR